MTVISHGEIQWLNSTNYIQIAYVRFVLRLCPQQKEVKEQPIMITNKLILVPIIYISWGGAILLDSLEHILGAIPTKIQFSESVMVWYVTRRLTLYHIVWLMYACDSRELQSQGAEACEQETDATFMLTSKV